MFTGFKWVGLQEYVWLYDLVLRLSPSFFLRSWWEPYVGMTNCNVSGFFLSGWLSSFIGQVNYYSSVSIVCNDITDWSTCPTRPDINSRYQPCLNCLKYRALNFISVSRHLFLLDLHGSSHIFFSPSWFAAENGHLLGWTLPKMTFYCTDIISSVLTIRILF